MFTVCLSLLTACAEESTYSYSYEDGYEDGYNDGQEEGYDNGYWEGYSEAESDFDNIIEYDAVHYAREYSEWHPEEAMCVIDAYRRGEAVTEADYNEAIESLYRYCQYLYYDMYK